MVRKVTAVTYITERQAQELLQNYNWNVELALEKFFQKPSANLERLFSRYQGKFSISEP